MIEIPTISLFLLSFTQLFYFWRDYNGNKAALLFHVIPVTAPYVKYIKIRVENFHLLIYVSYKIYAKAMLCKFLS